jgi:hypothetical protein
MASTTSSVAPATSAPSGGGSGSGPTSSPLLFFVALGFGVVFTNLWFVEMLCGVFVLSLIAL